MAIFCATCNAEHPPRPPGFNRSPRWIRLSRILTAEGVTSSTGGERFFCEACEPKLDAAIAVVAEMAAGNSVEIETITRLQDEIVRLKERLDTYRRNELRRAGARFAEVPTSYESGVAELLRNTTTRIAGSDIAVGDRLAYSPDGHVHPSPLEETGQVALSAALAGEPVYVRVGGPPRARRTSPKPPPPPPPRRSPPR